MTKCPTIQSYDESRPVQRTSLIACRLQSMSFEECLAAATTTLRLGEKAVGVYRVEPMEGGYTVGPASPLPYPPPHAQEFEAGTEVLPPAIRGQTSCCHQLWRYFHHDSPPCFTRSCPEAFLAHAKRRKQGIVHTTTCW